MKPPRIPLRIPIVFILVVISSIGLINPVTARGGRGTSSGGSAGRSRTSSGRVSTAAVSRTNGLYNPKNQVYLDIKYYNYLQDRDSSASSSLAINIVAIVVPVVLIALILVFLFTVFLLAKYFKVKFKESLEAIFCCRCYGIYYLKHMEPSSASKKKYDDGHIYDIDYQMPDVPPMALIIE